MPRLTPHVCRVGCGSLGGVPREYRKYPQAASAVCAAGRDVVLAIGAEGTVGLVSELLRIMADGSPKNGGLHRVRAPWSFPWSTPWSIPLNDPL